MTPEVDNNFGLDFAIVQDVPTARHSINFYIVLYVYDVFGVVHGHRPLEDLVLRLGKQPRAFSINLNS